MLHFANVRLFLLRLLVWHSIREADLLQTDMMQNSIDELLALQRLRVDGHPAKALRVLEVIWRPPPPGWLKVNTEEATSEGPGLAGCASIFCTCRGFVKSFFAIPLDVYFVFGAKLIVMST